MAALVDVAQAARAYLAANDALGLGDKYWNDRADASAVLRAALSRLEELP